MLLSIGRHVADDIKLDRLVPYIVSCLSDDVARVKAHAVKTLAKMVGPSCSNGSLVYILKIATCTYLTTLYALHI